MAQQEITPQNLYEFTNNLLEDLTSGAITPEEALIALEQYGYLRDYLAQSTNTLARSFSNTEAFSNELRMLVDRARGLLSQSLPQLRRTPPDGALPPAEIASRAQFFARARGNLTEVLAGRKIRLATSRREFITTLVNNWIEQSRGVISAEQAQAGASLIESTLAAALSSNTNLEIALGRVRTALEKSVPFAATTLEAAYQAVGPARQTLAAETNVFSRVSSAPTIILRHPEIRRTDWFTSVLLEQLSAATVSTQGAETTSTKLTKTAEVMSSPPPSSETLRRSGGLFSSFAQTGMQKALAGVADGVFLFLGPTTRDRVLQIVLAKTARRIVSDTDSLTKRLGETFVNSPAFAEIKQKLQETIVAPRDGVSPLTKTKSLVGDLFTTIVGSPIGSAMVGSPSEAIYTYLETLRLNAALSPEHRFWPSALPSEPTWQYLYIVSLNSAGGGYYQPGAPLSGLTSAGAPGTRGFGGFLLGATAGLGRVISAPLSLLGGGPGGGLLGFVNRGIESLFGSTFLSRWLGDARRRQAAPARLIDDLPLVVALVVVGAIVILFIIPTFFNFSYISQVSKTSALLCSEFTGGAYCGGGEGESGTQGGLCDPVADPSCITASCDPTKQDCRWPTSCGCIIREPFEKTHARYRLNAVDVVFGSCAQQIHVPVFATQTGTIIVASSQYRDNEYHSPGKSTYGNYVQIQGDDPPYQTLYAHLSTITVRAGDHVAIGQQIGTTDNNGISEGEHLHFEVIGLSSALNSQNTVLPKPGVSGTCF